MRLLNSQKDQIFVLLQKHNLAHQHFEWFISHDILATSIPFSVLRHQNSSFYFAVAYLESEFICVYSPGEETEVATERIPQYADPYGETMQTFGWSGVLACLSGWLNFLVRELEAPDYWHTILQQKIMPTTTLPNTSFTPDEQLRLKTELVNIKKHVMQTAQASQILEAKIDEHFAYLSDAVERMGRKDWLHILIAILVQTVFACAFTPDRAQELFQIAQSYVSNAVDTFKDFIGKNLIE